MHFLDSKKDANNGWFDTLPNKEHTMAHALGLSHEHEHEHAHAHDQKHPPITRHANRNTILMNMMILTVTTSTAPVATTARPMRTVMTATITVLSTPTPIHDDKHTKYHHEHND